MRWTRTHLLVLVAAWLAFAGYVFTAKADDQPPTGFRAPEQYTRTGIPQQPISHATTGDAAGDSATAVVRRDATTVCFAHYTQLVVGPCSAETHFLFSESQALTEVGAGASWGEDLDDPEGNSTLRDLVGPATGLVPHGFTVPSSGWKTVIVPGRLNESEVGYRGGYCSGGSGPGWPCDDDADCPSSGACESDADSFTRKRCLLLHSAAVADSTCQIEVYR